MEIFLVYLANSSAILKYFHDHHPPFNLPIIHYSSEYLCLDKEISPGEIAKDKTNILHIWGYTFEVSDIHTIDWQILNHYIYISD